MDSEQLQQDLRAGIGALVWMTLRDVELPRDELRSVFAAHGLEKAVARPPSVSATLSRATHDALVGVGGGWAFDRVRDDAATATAALSQRTRDPHSETVRYEQVGLLRVDKTTGGVARECVDETVNEILNRAEAHFVRVRKFATTTDLRAALRNALHGRRRDPLLGAVDVDGISFVLDAKRPTIEALAGWVSERGYGKVTVLALADDAATRRAVAAGARDTILARVQEIVATADSLRDRVASTPEDALDELLEPYLERFSLAEAQADVYAGILGTLSAELTEAIKAARTAFADRLL